MAVFASSDATEGVHAFLESGGRSSGTADVIGIADADEGEAE